MNLLGIVSFLIASYLHEVQGFGEINNRRFPAYFKFGASNAATQIEGAYLQDGKSESIWDRFVQVYPERIKDNSTPYIACDSYNKYKEDVAMVKSVGLDSYRFSIAWSRLLPKGDGKLNEKGVQYYKNLIKELKDNGIEPYVALYHWDLPQALEDSLGGWRNEKIVDLFVQYARHCFELFGEDVKWWFTFNEPKQVCHCGYGSAVYAPGVGSSGVGEYICSKNLLLAHAKVYRMYDAEFRQKQGGKISIIIDAIWYQAFTDSEEDKAAAETAMQFTYGFYGNPIYKGDWADIVKERIANRSKLEGFLESRLPAFSPSEIALIKGTSDFLSLNHYTTHYVNATAEVPIGKPSYRSDMGTFAWSDPHWPIGNNWIAVVPWGLRKLLVWLKETYGNAEIVITENGLADNNGTLEDDHRIVYFRGYLSSCLDAIYEDGVNLTSYFAWSIMDDWEWQDGYNSHLGMYSVNFTDPERTRTPRKSASYFTQVTKNRCLVENCVK